MRYATLMPSTGVMRGMKWLHYRLLNFRCIIMELLSYKMGEVFIFLRPTMSYGSWYVYPFIFRWNNSGYYGK